MRATALILGVLTLSGVGVAAESHMEGWEANLEQAVARAEKEQKLLMQFRLIGRFDRPDC